MIKDGLRKCIELKCISLDEISTMSNVPYETIRNILYGKTDNPKLHTIIALRDALGVTIEELLDEVSSNEQRLLKNYRTCGKHGKTLVEFIAEKHALAVEKEENMTKRTIPCYVPVSHLNDGMDEATSEVSYIETTNLNVFVGYKITTNNFYNQHFYDGDIILLERRMPEYGEKAVYSDGARAYFRIFEKSDKKGKRFVLKAMNNKGKDFYIDDNDNNFSCIGTCVDVVRE